jgi:hypothetical protein
VIRGKVTEIKKEVKCNIHNRFDIEVKDSRTGEIKNKAFAENIVLNALWTRLFTPTTYFNNIHYGTGTGTLDPARTSLFTFLGAKTAANKTVTWNEALGYVSSRKDCVIDATLGDIALVGQTLREVGIGYGETSSNLVTHAPLQDMNGNSISILIGAFDIITIYATVFVHWDVAGYDVGVGTQDKIRARSEFKESQFYSNFLAGDYAVSAGRPSNVNFGMGDIVATEFASGTRNYSFIANLTFIYDLVNKKIKLASPYRLASNLGNFGGIRNIALSCTEGNVSGNISPFLNFSVGGDWYKKTSILSEAIGTGDGVKTEFSTKFPFVLFGAKIYIDGVEQITGVNVITNTPHLNNTFIEKYFDVIEVSRIYGSGGTNSINRNLLMAIGSNTNGAVNATNENFAIVYNRYWEKGLLSHFGAAHRLQASNDLETWVNVTNATSEFGTYTIGSSLRNYKYWKISGFDTTVRSCKCMAFTAETWFTHNIKFDTPPAIGAVITADYDTETIAKDENHVFDFNFEITLGERV